MRQRSRTGLRAAVVAAFAAGPALLAAGCGTEATGSSATLVDIQPSSYVTIEPATTTTTTTIPDSELIAGGVSPTEQIYVVQSGDSISRIASLHDITMDALVAYNEWPNGLSHFLGVGDEVRIPPGSAIPGAGGGSSAGGDTGGGGTGGGDAPTPDAGTADETEASGGCTHTIVEGENPTRVANAYDITVDELRNANVGNNAINTFVVGQTLQIPPNGSC